MKRSKLLLGVSGSIAAYRIPDLAAGLRRAGFEVRTILTPGGEEFVTPTSVASMSRGDVYTDKERMINVWQPAHIELADWADMALVAPASAATIGKLAGGIATGLLAETFLALPQDTPKLVAPSMNGHMLEQPSVQRNLRLLEGDGYHIIPPREGELACGYEGLGKLATQEIILENLEQVRNEQT